MVAGQGKQTSLEIDNMTQPAHHSFVPPVYGDPPRKKPFIRYTAAFVFGAVLATFCYGMRPKPNLPTSAQIQSALSNNAAAYFRAGVLCGSAVDRAKPGLTSGQLIGTSVAYFATLGPDPYLAPAKTKLAQLEDALGKVKRMNVSETNTSSTNAP